MDPLTQTIALLRPQAFNWKEAEAAGDWALRFPGATGVAFCLIGAGSCRLDVLGQDTRPLGEGDYVLLAAPPAWTLSHGGPGPSIEFSRDPSESDRLKSFIGQRGGGPVTRLLGGHFRFDRANAERFASLVPPMVHIRSSEPGAGRLRTVLGLVDDEALADRPGRALVIERLLEVMLVEAIRHGAGLTGPVRQGLVAGLSDPQVAAALRALHADVRRGWTVEQLAGVAGASRSAFAERFSRLVGLPPIDYLQQWRMALAKDRLRSGGARLSEVAFACGYHSASAFSAAFSRVVGCSPARYAASGRARDSGEITTAPSAG